MPESLGRTLKKIRESRHLSTEEVSERSRIPRNIVSTIEEDRLAEIKSIFYAKSFVKTYASFLGALGETVVKEFLVGEGLKPSPTQPQKKPGMARREQACLFPTPNSLIKYKKQIIAVIIGILALWILSMAVGQAGKFIKNRPVKKQTKAAVTKKEEPKKIDKKNDIKKSVGEGLKPSPTEKPEFIEVEVSASDNTYLQIISDNDILFKGLFKKGGKDTWKARKELKLEAGNSGAIKISVNGKPANFAGKKGEKKEIIITKDGIKN
ncbi:MAG: RodZ domain-containing protein [Candidatus Omnitrophota bacterium]